MKFAHPKGAKAQRRLAGMALLAGIAAALPVASVAQAASNASLWPTRDDKAICDPIFSKLHQAERGILTAQAELPKPSAQTQVQDNKPAPSEEELTNQLSAMLQACSYDGKALKVNAKAMKSAGEPEGAAAVTKIMGFTGLPQNFTIVESEVPNAAAIIVVGADGIPKRVIAYNRGFMQQVARTTGEDGWPGLSILAHEIGHHLSGHTLMPGGSQPPIELEADKFSGFVLFKMGASLPQAEKAIATLIPEGDGPTHPGRTKRLAAVEAGWRQSCGQQQDSCGAEAVMAAAPKPAETQAQAKVAAGAPGAAQTPAGPEAIATANPGQATMPDIPGPASIAMPDPNGTAPSTQAAAIDRVPRLGPKETPSKFDRFVYDEVGVFDGAVREKLQATAFQFAAAANVEIVTVVARDLQGRTADDYALAFMRQLRVGKLDVGNGAVLVVAPDAKEVGVALGPGLLVQYENSEALKNGLRGFLKVVAGGGRPQAASSLISDTAYRIMRDTRALEWVIRYSSLAELQTAQARQQADRQKTGAPFNPATDPTFRKLLRVDATVVSITPDMKNRRLSVNEPRARQVGPAIQVRLADGKDAVLYVNRSVPALMPVPLDEGKRYAFIARDTILKTGAPQLDLVSYDLID